MDNSMKHEWHDTIPGLPAPIKFGGTQAYPVAPGFLVETWGGSSSNIEGDIPIIEGADELGGIKFGEDQFCGEERTGIWPTGGGGDNIENDYGFIEGDPVTGVIKFDWSLRGGTGEGIWPSGGGGEDGGRNIDPTDTVEFGGSDFVWPPGDTSPGPKAGDTFIP